MDFFVRKQFISAMLVFFALLFPLALPAVEQYNKAFSFELREVTLKDLFRYIEKNSEYVFLYASDKNLSKKVNVDVRNKTVREILDEVLEHTGLVYEIDGKQVIVKERKEVLAPANVVTQQQGKSVSGLLTDADGNPIIGATVIVKGTTNGVTTDVDGRYTLRGVKKGDIIQFSFIGFNTEEREYKGEVSINIRMMEASVGLEDVVVIGYGQQKKSSVVSAINTVSNKELTSPTRSLTNNLAGRLSGLIAVQRSGEPGYDNSEFWIRGVSSFAGGTSPLVLVDGVPREMADVEPDEIETFSLLKDAAATAVYGAEGANGVILITTKRGKTEKTRISLRAETSISQPTRLPEFANSYETLVAYNEAMVNSGSPAVYSDDILEKYRTNADPMLYPNVNWFDLLRDFTTNSRVTLNVRGGTEKAQYFVSGAFYSESGLYDSKTVDNYNANVGLKRFNLRSNIDLNITKTTKVNVDLSGQYLTTRYPGVGSSELFTRMAMVPGHLFPMIYEDGTLASHPDPTSTKVNPYNLLNHSGYTKEWRTKIQSKIGLEQKLDFLVKGLSYKASLAFDANMLYTMRRSKTVSQYFATGRDDNNKLIFVEKVKGSDVLGGAEPGSSGDKTIYFENSLNYSGLFGEVHNVSAMLLYMQKDYQPNYQPLAFRKQGVVGRVTYLYDDRYSVEANFGYTGSETFAKGHRFGFFPAVGAAWYISNEDFYNNSLKRIVNKLKVRASIGRTGNDNTGGARFLYRSSMNTGAPGYNVGYTEGGPNGWVGSGIVEGQFNSPNLGWEIETKQNYGLEMGFFDNRIDLQVDYFDNMRSDILLQRKTVSSTAGFQLSPWQNMGRVRNRGVDASLVMNYKVGEVLLSARGNFTYARNKILEYDEIPQKYDWMNVTGTRIGDRAVYEWIGFYTFDDFEITGEGIDRVYTLKKGVVSSGLSGDIRPGDLKYKDQNGDGIINSFDAVRGLIHPENPEIVYGFGFSGQWKNWSLSLFFQGAGNTATVLGGNGGAFWPFMGGIDDSRLRSVFLNHWTESDPDNFNVTYPRLRPQGYHAHNNAASTFWVRNAAFLRFKNLELSYELSKKVNSRLGISGARIYLMGNNLFVWDSIKMWDPEMGGASSGTSYPLTRTFTLGFDVTF